MHEVTVLSFANDNTFKSDGIFQSNGIPCFDPLCAIFSIYLVVDYQLTNTAAIIREKQNLIDLPEDMLEVTVFSRK